MATIKRSAGGRKIFADSLYAIALPFTSLPLQRKIPEFILWHDDIEVVDRKQRFRSRERLSALDWQAQWAKGCQLPSEQLHVGGDSQDSLRCLPTNGLSLSSGLTWSSAVGNAAVIGSKIKASSSPKS